MWFYQQDLCCPPKIGQLTDLMFMILGHFVGFKSILFTYSYAVWVSHDLACINELSWMYG